MTVRVVLAEDQALVRAGLASILATDAGIAVVGTVADGESLTRLVRREGPDVALVDVRMPVLDGLEATRRIVAGSPGTRVIVLTTFGEDEVVFEALRAGATAFLLKDTRPEDLIAAVHAVAAGESRLDPAVTGSVIAHFRRHAPSGSARRPVEGLTSREQEVLRLMARGRSNAEIAEDLVVSTGTVKTHVANVLAKLGVRDRVHAVIAAYEAGVVEP